MLGRISSKTASSSRVKSRSVLKAKLSTLDIQSDPKKSDIYEILSDIPKGDINQNQMERQYSIPFTSFGLANFTKTLCVANK